MLVGWRTRFPPRNIIMQDSLRTTCLYLIQFLLIVWSDLNIFTIYFTCVLLIICVEP